MIPNWAGVHPTIRIAFDLLAMAGIAYVLIHYGIGW